MSDGFSREMKPSPARVVITDEHGSHDASDLYLPPSVRPKVADVVVDPVTGGRKGQKLAQPSQIPPDVLWELAEHYGKGNAKYPDSEDGQPNWQRGYSWRLSVDALMRHLLAFLMGEDIDPETGSSHLIAVIWHCMTLRYFQLHGKGSDYR
jgi:hypothetical protein